MLSSHIFSIVMLTYRYDDYTSPQSRSAVAFWEMLPEDWLKLG